MLFNNDQKQQPSFCAKQFQVKQLQWFPAFERKQDLLGSLFYNLHFKNVIDCIALTGKFIY